MTQADLLNALRDCYDPIRKRNIVDLKLVCSATLTEDHDAPGHGIPGVPIRFRASVALFAPSSDEAANAQLAAQVENRLLGLPAISQAKVTLLPTPFPILR